VGVICDGTDKKYAGGTWHDVSITNPDVSTLMYVCVTDGCPEEGESAMQCKEGYQGPMCAVCSDGYFVKVRRCVKCSTPQWGLFFGCIAGIGFVMFFIVFSLMRYRRYLKLTQAFSHFKVFVSFVTVMSTVSLQFGIVWPTTFARALDGLSVLSFDFGVLAGMFCLVQIKFYHSLLISTGTLFVVCVGIIVVAKLRTINSRTINSLHSKAIWNNSLFVAVYIALFAYPVVSVKIVQLFACHEIVYSAASAAPSNISSVAVSTPPIKTFLRADYSSECYTPEWNIMAVYAGLWIAFYVIAFPLFVIHQLCIVWEQQAPLVDPCTLTVAERRSRLKSAQPRHERARALSGRLRGLSRLVPKFSASPPRDKTQPMFGFLADDYQTGMPMVFWEAQEMVRKLLLSVIGAFWSTKSTMCVATALLISATFQLLHTRYYPYKHLGLNRLQQLSLTVLSLTYFVGVLLKTQSVVPGDADNVGVLMVMLLIAVFVALVAAVMLELHELQKWKKEVLSAKEQLSTNSDFDSDLQDHVIAVGEIQLGKELGRGAEAVVRMGVYHGVPVAVKVTTLSMMQAIPMVEMLTIAQREAKVCCRTFA
jgi:hypothetical protein